jgi:hypothetical protein
MLDPSKCVKVSDDDPAAGTYSRYVAMVRFVFYCYYCVRAFVVLGGMPYDVLVADWV